MDISPHLNDFLAAARPGARFPVFAELPLADHTPVGIYAAIRRDGHGFILESGKLGRYSYVGAGASWIWRSSGRECRIIEDGAAGSLDGDPFALLESALAGETVIPNPHLENFTGGLVGYLSYDMARHIERLPEHAAHDLDIPESCFMRAESYYEIDHERRLLRVVTAPVLRDDVAMEEQYAAIVEVLRGMASAIEASPADPPAADAEPADAPVEANLSPGEFAAIVRRAKEYIAAGDIFQANLSVRFRQPLGVDPFRLYLELREVNPSPYMAYIDLPELAIVSASPELLLKVHGGVIETRPIAGTRPRGKSRQEDIANAEELIANEKERAEHLMLVDLERNDIGRVARYGSVEVDEFMAIEEYSHVIHIVSNVRGELAEGRSTFDAIRACFPGGTITGAPKVRSMEIIEELEPCRRGIYTGSIGWIGFDGDAELNIAIRTIVVKDAVAYAQAGAGIVADSVPELEYHESVRKAEAALEAIRRARAGRGASGGSAA